MPLTNMGAAAIGLLAVLMIASAYTQCATPNWDCARPGKCGNGGVCATFGLYQQCNCTSGWAGEVCQMTRDCRQGSCWNGKLCMSSGVCDCEGEYSDAICMLPYHALGHYFDAGCQAAHPCVIGIRQMALFHIWCRLTVIQVIMATQTHL